MSFYGPRVTLSEVKESFGRQHGSPHQCFPPKIKKLENNTFEILFSNGERRIRLHQTDIIVFDADGFSVHSGGYKTITIKDRLNKYLPAGWRVYSGQGTWYLRHGEDEAVFEDGMHSAHFARHVAKGLTPDGAFAAYYADCEAQK